MYCIVLIGPTGDHDSLHRARGLSRLGFPFTRLLQGQGWHRWGPLEASHARARGVCCSFYCNPVLMYPIVHRVQVIKELTIIIHSCIETIEATGVTMLYQSFNSSFSPARIVSVIDILMLAHASTWTRVMNFNPGRTHEIFS